MSTRTPRGRSPFGNESAQSPGVFGREYRALTIGILLSVAVVAFESLGVATILPVVARELDGMGAFGWGLAALMLANVLGTVVAGRSADRRGPVPAMWAGVTAFVLGCAVSGLAGSWPLFIAGRVLQGGGVGALMVLAYTVIGLSYPEKLRSRMYALLSSAWTIPALIGPSVAGILSDAVGWRWVFGMVIPLTAIASLLTAPGLQRVTCSPVREVSETHTVKPQRWWRGHVVSAIQLAAGSALLLQALLFERPLLMLIGIGVGVALAVPALRRVTPSGTLTARSGLGAGVVIRALLCGAYFGAEAFLPLGLQEVRGLNATVAGLGLSVGALTWVAGSLIQARWDASQASRPRSVVIGSLVLLLGTTGIAAAMSSTVPWWFAIVGWAIGGLGMGIAFNASTTETLSLAAPKEQGQVSSALQLAQTLATALIAGLGGAAIAHVASELLHVALLAVLSVTGMLAFFSALLARRVTD
ncbi:MFS transporter [Leucobacter sp. Psy1]|uniref:MFS transporter n=1 Tax=Leucobacter sp. Psy1 TaxID=2875729 RepID=UPI001CD3BF59|nr:MFS transporter [Leucobacter sp. Psy1]UBH07479.1 MFS transporter [Leucobacter sp. Psy1]